MPKRFSVIIVGAGPVGLITALKLARANVSVAVLDRSPTTNESPRALLYGLPAVKVFHEAGVADELRAAGQTPTRVSWRKRDGEVLAKLDVRYPKRTQDQTLVLPVGDLTAILHQILLKEATATVEFNHEVTGIREESGKAILDVDIHGVKNGEHDKSHTIYEADFVVGCDGARSTIRRSLFGRDFPGITWDRPLIATNVTFRFDVGDYDDANFIHDPEHGHLCSRINGKDLWRVAYVEQPDLTLEDYKARLHPKLKALLPGNPDPEQYTVEAMNPYRIHQRLAPSLRVGRFLLAGDAAHLNNPYGGLGLTTGIVDAGAVSDCLIGVLSGNADDTILDKYSEIRREIFTNFSDKYSRENYLRVIDSHPETLAKRDPFIQACKASETDSVVSDALNEWPMALYHDFTMYYNKKAAA
ncbi:Para-nitrophenol 4-monooxygenase [Cyphellophora attinorum]|uniref:Para-nitrophenol 4-monooxygenase n=1 Tax=Cyphellophora attinorum TaxID=1664694 RepID=A0A0N0NHM8_9EURO|nr:Para-nitrophenol 4-monooxygenase [Phialophora attinorum]KPI34748.1 Para-nitrophenol 4-monooxygenase [Phialophora attinorum]